MHHLEYVVLTLAEEWADQEFQRCCMLCCV